MYVVCKTRSVLDRNLICFIITFPPRNNSTHLLLLGRPFHPPCVHLLIVESLRSATGQCGQIGPPCLKLQPLSYPSPAKKINQTPLKKQSNNAIPWPFQPQPPCSLIDCCVVEFGDRAVRSNSPARLQIASSILPPPPPAEKNRPKSHIIPRPFQPPPSSMLVDCGVVEVGNWVVRSNLPAQSSKSDHTQVPRRR